MCADSLLRLEILPAQSGMRSQPAQCTLVDRVQPVRRAGEVERAAAGQQEQHVVAALRAHVVVEAAEHAHELEEHGDAAAVGVRADGERLGGKTPSRTHDVVKQ